MTRFLRVSGNSCDLIVRGAATGSNIGPHRGTSMQKHLKDALDRPLFMGWIRGNGSKPGRHWP